MVVKTDVELAGLVDTVDMPVSATVDIEAMQEWLEHELQYKAPKTSEGVAAWWRGIETKYEALPGLGLRREVYTRFPGTIGEYKEVSFRDIPTGRFVKYEAAEEMVREWWGR